MKLNNSGNVLASVLVVISIIIIIAFYTLESSLNVGKATSNSKIAGNSVININNKLIDDNYYSGSLSRTFNSSYSTIDLPLSKTVDLKIPKNSISNNTSLEVQFDGGGSNVLSIDIVSENDGKLLLNKSIDSKGGFTILDMSTWSDYQRIDYFDTQEHYLSNGQFSELSKFITDEIKKIGAPGSYMIIDFGEDININTFNFQLTQEGEDDYPHVLQLTLDNGLKYTFFTDPVKVSQTLFFPESVTQFIKIDFVSSKDGLFEAYNSQVSNNLSGNITTNDITYTVDVDGIYIFNIGGLSTISGLRFVNVYGGKNGRVTDNSFYSFLPDNPTFAYDKSSLSTGFDSLYFELCSGIGSCGAHVNINLN